MKTNKGASTVTMVVVVVIIIAALAAAWYYWAYQPSLAVVPYPPAQSTSTPGGTPTPSSSANAYASSQLGFTFNFPGDWKGFTVLTQTWKGYAISGTSGQGVIATGTEFIFRNPNWTAAKHYEDIPLMVFTTDQWKQYTAEQFNVSAAPIPASKIGENNKYVFAIPPRWDYDFSTGYEEAETIVKNNNPLQTSNL